MKAYKAWIDDDYQTSTVIFAENRQAAKVFAFNRSIIKWLWKHRAEPNNRHKWRRMMREVLS